MQYFIAFLEGIITFISPCLLPMLPIYVSYFAGGGERSTGKTLKSALGFVLGEQPGRKHPQPGLFLRPGFWRHFLPGLDALCGGFSGVRPGTCLPAGTRTGRSAHAAVLLHGAWNPLFAQRGAH